MFKEGKIKKWAIMEIESCCDALNDERCLNDKGDLRRRMASAWVVLRIINPNHPLIHQRAHRMKVPIITPY